MAQDIMRQFVEQNSKAILTQNAISSPEKADILLETEKTPKHLQGAWQKKFENQANKASPVIAQDKKKSIHRPPQIGVSAAQGVNKWQERREGNVPKVISGKGVPSLPPSMLKVVQKGGSTQQILKRTAKDLEKENPELAQQAEAFFYEKMGVALLNNFSKNLQPCHHCGRKFASDALKKHEGICAKTSPLPSKKPNS